MLRKNYELYENNIVKCKDSLYFLIEEVFSTQFPKLNQQK